MPNNPRVAQPLLAGIWWSIIVAVLAFIQTDGRADDASTGAENVSQSQTDAQVTDKLKKSLPAGFSLSPKKEPAIAPELQAVVDAWPTLPTDVRKMIEGVVKATVESGAERA